MLFSLFSSSDCSINMTDCLPKSRLGRLPRWQRYFIQLAMLTCSLSGALFLLGHHYGIRNPWLTQHTILLAHVITASLAILGLGSLLPFHLKAGFKAKSQIVSGISQLVLLGVLAISGWLLYYGPESARECTIQTHWIVGLVFFAIFISHGICRGNPRPPYRSTRP